MRQLQASAEANLQQRVHEYDPSLCLRALSSCRDTKAAECSQGGSLEGELNPVGRSHQRRLAASSQNCDGVEEARLGSAAARTLCEHVACSGVPRDEASV